MNETKRMKLNRVAATLLLTAGLLSGCSDDQPPAKTASSGLSQAELTAEPAAKDGEYRELSWDDLIPADWAPDKLMADYSADELTDEDPRAQKLMAKLKQLWKEAPVVPALDGARVKLPGFVVPLEADAESVREFLLVPYYGACIHVPPPPANQTVMVRTLPDGAYTGQLFDAVWVTGTLHVKPVSSDLAEAGYTLDGAAVTPYE